MIELSFNLMFKKLKLKKNVGGVKLKFKRDEYFTNLILNLTDHRLHLSLFRQYLLFFSAFP